MNIESRFVDGKTKGLPYDTTPVTEADIGTQGWNLLRGDLPVPVAVLKQSTLRHNSRWMRQFVECNGIMFAPHGKTTMCPDIFHLQLSDGAWGITAATVQQVRVYRDAGVARIFLANQMVTRLEIAYIAAELERDAQFEFICLVDSIAGCEILARELRAVGASKRLQVMVEIGIPNRRTGCRSKQETIAVAKAISANQDVLNLVGVEGFEGMAYTPGITEDQLQNRIVSFLDELGETAVLLHGLGLLTGPSLLLSAGGSTHYDVVVERLCESVVGMPTRVILRSGCYISHDHRMYRELFEKLRVRSADICARAGEDGLQPALEVWSVVQSRPDPNRVICSLGKRDVGTDAGNPILYRWFRSGSHSEPVTDVIKGEVVEVNDQHAHLTVHDDCPLEVGDLVCFGISHPCTTFDKWKLIPVVDDDYNVVSAVRTYF